MASEKQQEKWIKEGRGSGEGSLYKPWITVRDIPSSGRSHRVYGYKSKRTHHLLSDLELAIFLLFEWNERTSDIREQFPLRLEDTKIIANEAQIKHPSMQGVDQVMSSDFYILTSDYPQQRFAIQAKYHSDLDKTRVIEKLEIERRYWQQKDVPWKIITELDISKVVFQNIQWLYPRIEDEQLKLLEKIEFYTSQLVKYQHLSLMDFTKKIDTAYDLELGTSLGELRSLIAQRFFKFDLRTSYKKLNVQDIHLGTEALWEDIYNVAG
ncbi:heteromeric transposase endonuclease subunit TnsA [Wohlfahrtiimonas chitiniclastica]|uniref:TnsA endonuclease N-terminal domain-containing protein n=1 Tax=Wohlfahrtiimonas chitiniclastica TaxID=400946 RepID=UPI000B991B1D|nr:TnsA endonuclease N-terminal domain-containing protein [Wohlfahrtiimonas chitiniclastica]OYQ89086.1 heteromeric transposase endonuclease subunit TnsA [Wohlfahrtiimonas chitiniclastica]